MIFGGEIMAKKLTKKQIDDARLTVIDKEKHIKQSNRLVEARYKLTALEQRIIIAIASQIKKNADEFELIKISVNDLADFCGLISENRYMRLKSAITSLARQTISILYPDGGWRITHWLQTVEYIPSESVIACEIDSTLKPDFLRLKAAYVDAPAAPLMKFRHVYSIRFYFLLKKSLKLHTVTCTFDELRLLFQLTKETNPARKDVYVQATHIKQKVIEPAMKELNEKSDLSISHEYLKTGRKITAVRFTVVEKTKDKVNEEAKEKCTAELKCGKSDMPKESSQRSGVMSYVDEGDLL